MEKRFYDEYMVGLITGSLKKGMVFKFFWWMFVAIASLIIWMITVDGYTKNKEIGMIQFIGLFIFIFAVMITENLTYREVNIIHPQFKSVDTIMSFLPIDKSEIPKKACANRIINGIPVFIFMSVIIFVKNPTGDLIGARGMLLSASILILTYFTVDNINLYTQRFWKIKVKQKVKVEEKKGAGKLARDFIFFSLTYFIISVVIDAFTGGGVFENVSLKLHSLLINFLPFQILGNKFVGIFLLGVIGKAFYYYNYTYILNGVKEEGWKLWKD